MNSSTKIYDYIIVGAGASGLMMAYRMSKDAYFKNKTILILDKEKKTSNDRTWCFWENKKGDWDAILNHFWKSIIFKGDSIAETLSIKPYQYKMIRSSDFYDNIWVEISKHQNFEFKIESVKSVQQEHNLGKVITDSGSYSSQNIINSILFTDAYKKQKQYPVLQQHFVGYFVKTKTAVFDDTAATFMDFTVPQKGNTRFMYILPYSKNEALFEYTLFSKELLKYETYTNAITEYLQEKNITDYEIIEKEQGSIPMTSFKFWELNSKNVIHIGTAGGWSKASTGFTFKNIDKKTTKLVQHLKKQKPLNTFHKTNRFWFYDLLLLDILSQKNELGAAIFSKMFKSISPQLIFRFLDEQTTFIEELKIFSKMPTALFSKALLKRLF